MRIFLAIEQLFEICKNGKMFSAHKTRLSLAINVETNE